RLWSALPAFGTAILTWNLGKLLYGGYTGMLSALILVSSVGVFRSVKVAATDFLLVFSITLALYGFVKAYQSTVDRRPSTVNRQWSLLFWLGMALGVLSKGLIGVVFPLLIITLWAIVNSQWSRVNGGGRRTIDDLRLTIYSPVGLLLFLGLTVPWHVLAAHRNSGFFDFYIIDNQLLRFFNRRGFIEDDIPVGTLSFLILTLVGFFPWSLFLPAALRHAFPRFASAASLQERLRLVVGLWVVVVLGFFSLSSSKLEHYYLPAVPALSLMVGAAWARVVNSQWSIVNRQSSFPPPIDQLPLTNDSRRSRVLMRWCLGVGALGCAVVGLGLFLFADLFTPQMLMAGLAGLDVDYRILQAQGTAFPFAVFPFIELIKVLGISLVLACPLAYLFLRRRKPTASFVTLLGLAGIIAVLEVRFVLLVEPHHSSRSVAEALASQAGANDVIVHEGSLEYSGGLPFYTAKKIHILNGRRGSLDFGSRYQDASPLFLDEDRFHDLWKSHKRVFLIRRLPQKESLLRDISEEVFFVGQFGSRRLYTNKPL
ncbi:MAG: phospholipid carrier-dependent glycosyltransferase, partial [Deltaproteobacteria bacterium]|nr:phospholipid carrier-dependent glycosyltransferase [Deltaproteobacteria bacterium]